VDEETRNLDLLVGELEQENKLMRARNERLQQEFDRALDENALLKITLERIIAISNMAFRDGGTKGVGEVGAQEQGANVK
jgi:hypothetical protein